jgi:hypothetical protein
MTGKVMVRTTALTSMMDAHLQDPSMHRAAKHLCDCSLDLCLCLPRFKWTRGHGRTGLTDYMPGPSDLSPILNHTAETWLP